MATKLMQWLFGLSLFFTVWSSLVFQLVPIQLDSRVYEILWPLPVYLIIVFGSYSLAVIGYRVATFNDCEEAAASLKQEIEEARRDLTKKGLKFS
ncbi:dolichol-phosphate mannosyltransferase subunit 3-like [Anneissia japonica]|uniref:dolichol-phosphate mannosyltransferase subunit 3-like n=1 Tax=Anneissia japonica TaxID=1529436 RepID=UPI001425AE03|nr:dolichol-phosphate mannosyltransferase subunit 3-like [Anneissia japonica]XP_033109668.1 dolichol-phosphate mannosyltransferase subunit 3-like [Anneissia japonica]